MKEWSYAHKFVFRPEQQQVGCGGRLDMAAGWTRWQVGCGSRLEVAAGWLWRQVGHGRRLDDTPLQCPDSGPPCDELGNCSVGSGSEKSIHCY